jgi:PAS domain S-box-containing protein
MKTEDEGRVSFAEIFERDSLVNFFIEGKLKERLQKTSGALLPEAVLTGTLILSALPLLAFEIFPELRFVLTPASYLVFHNIAEFFSVMVSLSMFGIGWYTFDQSKDRHALFLSTAFLGIGLMDFMHALANAAMPPFITPNSSNKSTQFWIAVRLFQAAAFLISAYVYPERPRRWLSKKALMTSSLLVSFLVFTGITFFPAYLPATFVPGAGLTSFKTISEYLIIGMLCAAALTYWRRMIKTGEIRLIYFAAAFVICIFSELSLAVYTRVFDTYNVLGHIYKVAAFYLIYHGIFRASVKAPYLRLIDVGEKLKEEIAERKCTEETLRQAHNHLELRVLERTAELAQSNEKLQSEIEDRQKAEKKLRLAYERLQTFFDRRIDGIGIVISNSEGNILQANNYYLSILGFSREELLSGKIDWRRMTPPEWLAADERSLIQLRERGVSDTYEKEYLRRDGSRVPVLLTKAMMPGESGGILVFVLDISARKRDEQALRQLNETLEQRVAERTELAESRARQLQALVSELALAEQRERRRLAEILHDHLQQLLVAARMNCEILSAGVGTEHKQAAENIISLIARSIQTSRSLTAELSPPILQQGGLSAAIEWLSRWMQENHGLTVELKTDPDMDPEREDTTVILFQSIRELLFNVVKHAGVKSARVEMCRDGENRLRVNVIDRGSGFDPGATWENEKESTGFGIFSIRERLMLLGGALEVESAPGAGASFSLVVPLELTKEKRREKRTEKAISAIRGDTE